MSASPRSDVRFAPPPRCRSSQSLLPVAACAALAARRLCAARRALGHGGVRCRGPRGRTPRAAHAAHA
eukprot:5397301-Pleurochrysis_carterae.AAC.1